MFGWLKETLENAKYNRELYRSGKANKNEVRHTTVGWRRDPICGEDGYTPDPGNDRIRYDGNGVEEYDTPSGNREYYRVINKKTDNTTKTSKAARRLADMASAHAYLDMLSSDEVKLELIATFENHKREFTKEQQNTIKEIILEAMSIMDK